MQDLNNNERKKILHEIIFGTETPAGKLFDVWLIILILLSVGTLILDSVEYIHMRWHVWLYSAEWVFTILFTVEYATRIYISARPWRYVRSFFGIIDLLSVIPTYLGLFITGANFLLIVRLIRVLRVFRVLKLVRYLSEANVLLRALSMSHRKIFVFFVAVLVLSTIFGSVMFVVEGPENGFTSIPISIYWTIVTITTVGYGDITPHTAIGKIVASLAMLTGYSIIAVPTGILTAELHNEMSRERLAIQCKSCERFGHDTDARFCKHCGANFKDPY